MAVSNEKQKKIKSAVEMLFNQERTAEKPNWVSFFRRVLGRYGLIQRAYPSIEDRSHFEKTDVYRSIQCMLTELRKLTPIEPAPTDTKVITVRIPTALHEALAAEARDFSTSVNKLCISKLVQIIDAERIPSPRREQSPEELMWMEDALFRDGDEPAVDGHLNDETGIRPESNGRFPLEKTLDS